MADVIPSGNMTNPFSWAQINAQMNNSAMENSNQRAQADEHLVFQTEANRQNAVVENMWAQQAAAAKAARSGGRGSPGTPGTGPNGEDLVYMNEVIYKTLETNGLLEGYSQGLVPAGPPNNRGQIPMRRLTAEERASGLYATPSYGAPQGNPAPTVDPTQVLPTDGASAAARQVGQIVGSTPPPAAVTPPVTTRPVDVKVGPDGVNVTMTDGSQRTVK